MRTIKSLVCAAAAVAVLLVPSLAAADSVAGEDPALLWSWYRQQYGTAERDARTRVEQRVAFAKTLIQHSKAGSASDARKLFLLERAYQLGASHRDGYETAAAALERMREVDQKQNISTLLRLKVLYEKVYRPKHMRRIGVGKRLGELYVTIGQAYLKQTQTVTADSEAAMLEKVLLAIRNADRHFLLAKRTFALLDTRLQFILRSPTLNNRQRIVNMRREIAKHVDRNHQHIEAMRRDGIAWAAVRRNVKTFASTRSPDAAAEIVDHYLLLGRHDQAMAYAPHMPEKDRDLVMVMHKPMAGLKATQAQGLADRYVSMARRAPIARRVAFLKQAKTYLLYTDRTAASSETQERVDAALTLLKSHGSSATAFVD